LWDFCRLYRGLGNAGLELLHELIGLCKPGLPVTLVEDAVGLHVRVDAGCRPTRRRHHRLRRRFLE
jgi:hypothetical protein